MHVCKLGKCILQTICVTEQKEEMWKENWSKIEEGKNIGPKSRERREKNGKERENRKIL